MTLVLLPNVLDESLPYEPFLPMSVGHTVRSLQGLIAESEKSGRRYLRRFLSHEEMAALPIRLLNEHTKSEELLDLIKPLQKGEKWGLVTDAGLPCLADPGAELVSLARYQGIMIEAIAGPCSIILALQLCGFPSQRFGFHGYLPREAVGLEQAIRDLEKRSRAESSTQLFIEAPYRSAKILDVLLGILQPTTRLCVAASLTSPQEKIVTQTIAKWKEQKIQLRKEPAVFLIRADG